MIVCGLDPSLTSTGVAILINGQPQTPITVGLPGHDGATWDERLDRITATARAIIDTTLTHGRPDLLLIEGPAYQARYGNVFDRTGLWCGIYSKIKALRIPRIVIAPKTRALWATGNGNATKDQVTTAVQTWWPDLTIRNDDIADALTLATIGAAHLGDPTPFPLTNRHHAALAARTWPEVIP